MDPGRRRVLSGKVDWTKATVGRLIELYKHFSDIWDSSSPMYSDRPHRKKLMEKIAQLMQIDVRDVSSKIHNIRCQYNSEIRKIKRDTDYIPRWEFFETLSFLENATKNKKPTISTTYKVESNLIESNLNDSSDYEFQENVTKAEEEFIEEHLNDIEFKEPEKNVIITEDIRLENPKITNITKTITAMRNKSPSPKRKKAEKAKIILKNRALSNDAVMANAMKTLSSSFDSHKIFCDYVADQMRAMSDKKCKKLKRIIQKAIVQLEDSDEDPLYM